MGRGEGEEADTWGPRVHAHFTHVILYTSTASIETSSDYYTDKNVVLRPARMIYREGHTPLVLNYIGLHHSMHAHYRKETCKCV